MLGSISSNDQVLCTRAVGGVWEIYAVLRIQPGAPVLYLSYYVLDPSLLRF